MPERGRNVVLRAVICTLPESRRLRRSGMRRSHVKNAGRCCTHLAYGRYTILLDRVPGRVKRSHLWRSRIEVRESSPSRHTERRRETRRRVNKAHPIAAWIMNYPHRSTQPLPRNINRICHGYRQLYINAPQPINIRLRKTGTYRHTSLPIERAMLPSVSTHLLVLPLREAILPCLFVHLVSLE